MNLLKKCFFAPLLLVLCLGCNRRTETVTPGGAAATVDFSAYIAIGDSQTAGYANDGLYQTGQINSYPNILAGQLKDLGNKGFSQPLFSDAQANGSGYLKLTGIGADGVPTTTRVTDKLAVRGTVTIPGYGSVTLYTKYQGANQNFGVPGIKLADINSTNYGNLNGYFERLLPTASPNNMTTYAQQVTASPFTFFSCWLGSNDALGYALAGGAGVALTDKTTFSQIYEAFLNDLIAKGQKGVLATIPEVSAIPYFNILTIPQLLAAAQKVNPEVANIYIQSRNSADNNYTVRMATAKDLLMPTFKASTIGQAVSTASGSQPYGLSPLAPIENKYVLDQSEVALVKDYTNAYNTAINNLATIRGLAVFDVSTLFNTLKQGATISGVTVSADPLTGNIFSLDGIHLTPRGYALEANGFISAINAKYGTAIKPVDISKYDGLK